MGNWTDDECYKFMSRATKLIAIGLTQNDAERLAEQMLYRDRPDSGDDRRICLECANLKRTVCTAAQRMGLRRGMEPVTTLLQRCDKFTMRGEKTA